MYYFDMNGNEVIIGDWIWIQDPERIPAMIWKVTEDGKIETRSLTSPYKYYSPRLVQQLRKISVSDAALLVLERDYERS